MKLFKDVKIESLIANKGSMERAIIKSHEIVKLGLSGEYISDKYGLRVELIGDIKKIDGGIELFAKAWKGGKQLGFGKDGSVEIERFKIYNPPVLVGDPNGTIIREYTDDDTGVKQRRLREDPAEAIRRTLAHTVKVVGKENTKIVKGKIGNTTSTFYPDAHPETTSGDVSFTKFVAAGESWSDLRTLSTGMSVLDEATRVNATGFRSDGDTDEWDKMYRFGAGWDTSPIGSDVVDSATVSYYVYSGTNEGYSDSANVTAWTPASATSFVDDDYFAYGGTKYSDDDKDLATVLASINQYHDWALNATGIGAVDTGGITSIMARSVRDIEDSEPTWPTPREEAGLNFSTADQTGTDEDPKLVVEHSAAAAKVPISTLALMGAG